MSSATRARQRADSLWARDVQSALAAQPLAERFPLGARVEARVLALTKTGAAGQGGGAAAATGASYVLDVTLRAVGDGDGGHGSLG